MEPLAKAAFDRDGFVRWPNFLTATDWSATIDYAGSHAAPPLTYIRARDEGIGAVAAGASFGALTDDDRA